jgi:hypothetical protein
VKLLVPHQLQASKIAVAANSAGSYDEAQASDVQTGSASSGGGAGSITAATAEADQQGAGGITMATINFVDLAGSERAALGADVGEKEKLRLKEVHAYVSVLAFQQWIPAC